MNKAMTVSKSHIKIKPRIITLLAVLLTLGSCGPLKDAVTPGPDLERLSVENTLESMNNRATVFDFFSTRFAGTASLDGQEMSISGNIRIKQDSLIYISISPLLGIEIARVLITPDSVSMINRLDKTYYIGDMGVINNMLNTQLDFYMLQALLTGNDFKHFSTDDFMITQDRNMLLLQSRNRRPLSKTIGNISFQQNIWVNTESFRIEENLLYEPLSQRSLRAKYRNPFVLDGQQFPGDISLVITEPGTRADLNIRYGRTTIDQPQSMSLTIPDSYSRISF
jgi:hypothetical protein